MFIRGIGALELPVLEGCRVLDDSDTFCTICLQLAAVGQDFDLRAPCPPSRFESILSAFVGEQSRLALLHICAVVWAHAAERCEERGLV